MHLECPACGHVIPAEDINIDTVIAKCSACDVVFDFQDRFGSAPVSRTRKATSRPDGISIDATPDYLQMKRPWFSPTTLFLVFFCIVWDGFLVVWYFIAFTQSGPLIMKLFPLGHLAVGIGITWFTAASILNTTTIRADYELLIINHAPVPWPGNKRLPAARIEQIYCQKSIVQKNNRHTFHVCARSVEGRKIKLLSGLSTMNEALYIEQELERFLGIENAHVLGEVEG